MEIREVLVNAQEAMVELIQACSITARAPYESLSAPEKQERLEGILSNLTAGHTRFKRSAIFNQVVQMILRDVDHMVIIDQLIMGADSSRQALEEQLIRNG